MTWWNPGGTANNAGQWWNNANNQANDFLNTNSNAGAVDIPVYGAQAQGCVNSTNCAAGWKCAGGICIAPEPTGGDFSNCDGDSEGGEDGGPGCPASNASTDNDCTQTGPGAECSGDVGYEACCSDQRCCRFGIYGIACQCGPCEDRNECVEFCNSYKQANGESAAGCRRGECNECTSCEVWGSSGASLIRRCQLKDKGEAPCHCELPEKYGKDASRCGDCEMCQEDGECAYDAKNCDVCCELTAPCECNPEVEYTMKVCINKYDAQQYQVNCNKLANKFIQEKCEKEGVCDKCEPEEPTCATATRCTDTGTGIASCPENYTQTGTMTVGGETCVFCEDCSQKAVDDSCCPVTCNCHTDCGECYNCVNGDCQADPYCPGRWTFTGTMTGQGREVAISWSYNVLQGDVMGFVPAAYMSDALYDSSPNPNSGFIVDLGDRGTEASTEANASFVDFCNNEDGFIGGTDQTGQGAFYMYVTKKTGEDGPQTYGAIQINSADFLEGGCGPYSISGSWSVEPNIQVQ